MASIRKRGNAFTITAYMGYDANGRQIKKTTTFRPPEGVSEGKAEKLAKNYAATWEDKIRGYVTLDENRTFAELAEWYYKDVAPVILKPNVLIDSRDTINSLVMPVLARKRLKEISPALLDSMFSDMQKNGRKKDTYRAKEGFQIQAGGIAAAARSMGIARVTVQRFNDRLGIKKDKAQIIADFIEQPFDTVFESDVDDHSLSVNTIVHVKRCLSSIFGAAVQKEIMRRNPCANTVRLKRPQAAASFLDETQALDLIDALDQQPDRQFKVMINTLLFTGMRGGELCGLQWQDIDFEHRIIYIRHTLAYYRHSSGADQVEGSKRKGLYTLQSTKTEAGERYVAIPDSLVVMLQDHKQQQDQAKAVAGDIWAEPDMVFTSALGEYYSETYLNTKFKRFLRKYGLPDDLHIHSLRHTTASLLINSGVPPKVIADQLGHASTKVTCDIYSHIFASSRARAAEALDLKLNRAVV